MAEMLLRESYSSVSCPHHGQAVDKLPRDRGTQGPCLKFCKLRGSEPVLLHLGLQNEALGPSTLPPHQADSQAGDPWALSLPVPRVQSWLDRVWGMSLSPYPLSSSSLATWHAWGCAFRADSQVTFTSGSGLWPCF